MSTPKNDDSNTSGDLEEKWTFESSKQENGKTYMNDELFVEFEATSKDENGYMHFNADGSFESKIGYTQIITTKTMGVPQTQETVIEPVESEGTYTYNKDTKVITVNMESNSEVFEYTVQELTNSKLRMTFKLDVTQNTGDMDVRNVADMYLTFSR